MLYSCHMWGTCKDECLWWNTESDINGQSSSFCFLIGTVVGWHGFVEFRISVKMTRAETSNCPCLFLSLPSSARCQMPNWYEKNCIYFCLLLFCKRFVLCVCVWISCSFMQRAILEWRWSWFAFLDFGAVIFWGQTRTIWFCRCAASGRKRAAALRHFKTTTY